MGGVGNSGVGVGESQVGQVNQRVYRGDGGQEGGQGRHLQQRERGGGQRDLHQDQGESRRRSGLIHVTELPRL